MYCTGFSALPGPQQPLIELERGEIQDDPAYCDRDQWSSVEIGEGFCNHFVKET